MVSIDEVVALAWGLVNEVATELEGGRCGLKEVEERVLGFVHQIGALMIEEIVERVGEPTQENTITVDGLRARYRGQENLRFISRFGSEVVKSRRRYHVEGEGSYCPLDEKLGVSGCRGFSPLMSYLLALFGGCTPYEASARQLTTAVGFGFERHGGGAQYRGGRPAVSHAPV